MEHPESTLGVEKLNNWRAAERDKVEISYTSRGLLREYNDISEHEPSLLTEEGDIIPMRVSWA